MIMNISIKIYWKEGYVMSILLIGGDSLGNIKVKIAFSKRSWTHMGKKIQECAKELANVKKVII